MNGFILDKTKPNQTNKIRKMKTILKSMFATAALALAMGFGASPSAQADVLDTDVLNEGQTMTYTMFFVAGQRVHLGVLADEDCIDVDLVVFDPHGRRVAEDILTDAYPVVDFLAPVTGNYTIQVRMVDTWRGVPSIYQLISL